MVQVPQAIESLMSKVRLESDNMEVKGLVYGEFNWCGANMVVFTLINF